MSRSDLREKLKALESEVAHEARHQGEREADSEFEEKFKHYYAAGKLEEVLASIRDLLASHEAREGDSGVLTALEGLRRGFSQRHDAGDAPPPGLPHYGDVATVLVTAAAEIRRLRSHTDREPEPDGWITRGAAEEYRSTDLPFKVFTASSYFEDGEDVLPVRIGPEAVESEIARLHSRADRGPAGWTTEGRRARLSEGQTVNVFSRRTRDACLPVYIGPPVQPEEES